MIILSAYPAALGVDSGRSHLAELGEFAQTLIPKEAALHLLPYHPSDGDSGFAPSDWYEVDDEYGSWSELESLVGSRRTIVDGVYNHVGINHPIARSFFDDPIAKSHLVYAFRGAPSGWETASPRGGPAIRTRLIRGEPWSVWQTFNEFAVDIRLDDPEIRGAVARHLKHLSSMGVWGIRLDAAAYYAKPASSRDVQLHNKEAPRIARAIAALAQSHGLEVIAQLDCDEFGAVYFNREHNVTIVDYSYSAHLCLALLTSDARNLVDHVRDTDALDVRLIRAPRTHDGILMKSGLLSSADRARLVDVVGKLGIRPRIINGIPYELNSSLPFLFGRDSLRHQWPRIEISIALSATLSGWCVLYLPMLICFEPERSAAGAADPRELNRSRVNSGFWRRFAASTAGGELRSLLTFLVRLKEASPNEDRLLTKCVDQRGRCIAVYRPISKILLIANLSNRDHFSVDAIVNGDTLFGRRVSGRVLAPLGFGYWYCATLPIVDSWPNAS